MAPREATYRGARGPSIHDPERFWVAERYVAADQECSFCGCSIPYKHPRRGDRTMPTVAYRNAMNGMWECVACRWEWDRADLERHRLAIADAHPRAAPSLGL